MNKDTNSFEKNKIGIKIQINKMNKKLIMEKFLWMNKWKDDQQN